MVSVGLSSFNMSYLPSCLCPEQIFSVSAELLSPQTSDKTTGNHVDTTQLDSLKQEAQLVSSVLLQVTNLGLYLGRKWPSLRRQHCLSLNPSLCRRLPVPLVAFLITHTHHQGKKVVQKFFNFL